MQSIRNLAIIAHVDHGKTTLVDKIIHATNLLRENQDKGEVYDAPCDVVLSQHTVVQPDLIYVSKENKHIIGKQNIQGAPDLVIEILSPSTRRRDVLTKSKIYAGHGIPFYWVVDPEMDRIETYGLKDGVYCPAGTHVAPEVMKSSSLPGVELPLDYVFAD